MTKRLKIADIGYDPKYYPRVNGHEDWQTVLRYINALHAAPDKDFDPIVVVKAMGLPQPWMLLDGLHRIRAYHRVDREDIPAIIERLPRNRWLARSVELNIRHGRPMDTGDKVWTALRLREDGMSDANIASLLCEPIERLEKIIAERAIPIKLKDAQAIPRGRSNREVGDKHYGFLKAPFVEQDMSPAQETEALKRQEPISSMSVLNVLDSAIALLSAGVDMTREDVAERVQRLNTIVRSLVGQ